MADNDEGQNENTGGGLRKQLEDALETINSLKAEIATGNDARRELAFTKAGIDTSQGVGKLLAKTYDGDLDPEEIQAFAQEYGIEGVTKDAQEDAEAVETQGRMDSLRQQSRPDASGQKLSHQDWLALSESDPLAAQQAHANGQVEFPPHMAQQLAANQQITRLGAG
ncbi:MAG TPA: hypothetical protein VIG24_01175 [Acidimicrobiia bacterium]